MSDTAPKRSWFRPGGIILMLFVLGLFVWGNLSTRGASAWDSLCVAPPYISETMERFIYVKGLPFAFFAEHEWGGWPHREYLFWFPLLLNVAVCASAMASVARAWSVWSAGLGGKIRLQFHLSTAVILMFVAGLVVWANCAPSSQGGRLTPVIASGKVINAYFLSYRYYGWPLPVWEVDYSEGPREGPGNVQLNGPFRSNGEAAAHLVYDILACLTIVFFVGLACEAWIVWRARRNR